MPQSTKDYKQIKQTVMNDGNGMDWNLVHQKSKRHLIVTMNCKDPNLWSEYYVHRRQIPIDNAMCIEKGKALNNLKCNCFNISITAR